MDGTFGNRGGNRSGNCGGIAQHVIQRGTNRALLFFGATDQRAFLRTLARIAPDRECRIHAYVLMGNHVHLLLTPGRASGLADLMRAVRIGYGRHLEENRAGAGRLLEERFEASSVHAARHLLACMRYIELNPVKARMVRRPAEYLWSSYGANAAGREDALVDPHPHYLALGRSPECRQAVYRGSVMALLGETPAVARSRPGKP